MAIPDLVRGCPLLFELYDDEIHRILKHCQVLSFVEGQKLITDGETGDQIFVILDGQVEVQKQTPSGLIHIQKLSSGDVFGEMILVGEKTRTADVVALSSCNVIELKYDNIFDLYKRDSKIFSLMVLNIARLISKKLKNSNDVILELQKKSAA